MHQGILDEEGNYPLFLQRFHMMVAKLVNHHRGRFGSLFDDRQTSMVELAAPEDIFDKMIYSLTNAVAAGLVERADEWPGVSSLEAQLNDEELVIPRPVVNGFFPDDTTMPAVARIRFRRPPGFEHLSHRAWTDMIRAEIRRRERAAMEDLRARDRRVLGLSGIAAQEPDERPASHDPRCGINPRVAARDRWVRAEMLQRNQDWHDRYIKARAEWRAGNRDVVFPEGTWKYCVEHHARRRPQD